MIWAQDNRGAIGKQGDIPWFIPEDLKFFKDTTLNCAVIMGRKTWESLPPNFRPLPNRQNIVITSDPTYIALGAKTVLDPEAALAAVDNGKLAWVIGGASVYNFFLNYASKLLVTEVNLCIDDADTWAPEPSIMNFHKASQTGFIESVKQISYRYTTYLNRYIHATPLAEVMHHIAKASKQDENKFSERPTP